MRAASKKFTVALAIAIGAAAVAASAPAWAENGAEAAARHASEALQQQQLYYYGYGPYGYGAPPGDLGFAILGAANGGGLRGFVECGNYYARYPGACGF